jgi:hypothetical protein
MITPVFLARMSGTTAWANRKIDFTLTARSRSNHLQHRSPDVAHAGIVDEDVDRPEGIDRGLHRGINVGALRDIAAHGNGLVADGGCRCPRGPLVDVDDGNTRALPRERLGNALAETGSGAGHQRNLVVETHVASFPPRRIQTAPLRGVD